MNAENILNTLKKHGALGALCLWLVSLQFEIKEVKEKLYNCYESKNNFQVKKVDSKVYYFDQKLAILPEEIKIKKDETT